MKIEEVLGRVRLWRTCPPLEVILQLAGINAIDIQRII